MLPSSIIFSYTWFITIYQLTIFMSSVSVFLQTFNKTRVYILINISNMFFPSSWDEYILLLMISYSVHSYIYLYFFLLYKEQIAKEFMISSFMLKAFLHNWWLTHIKKYLNSFSWWPSSFAISHITFSLHCKDKSDWQKRQPFTIYVKDKVIFSKMLATTKE